MASQKIKIVLIDDEVDLCFLLAGILSAQNFAVSFFHTLNNGIQAIKETQPQWVIIDNNLPDGLGWERIDEIIDLVPNVHMILITANPDSHHTNKSAFVHYLVKPIDGNSIIDLIKTQKNF